MKKFAIHFVRSLLIFLLLGLPASFLMTFVFSQPNQVKTMLRQTGIYQRLSSVAVDNALIAVRASGQVPGVSGDSITRSAQKAFSPQDMQSKGEALVDQVYAWLNGTRASFEPHIDISTNEQVFRQSLADETVQEISNKPVCTFQQLNQLAGRDTTQLLQSPCRPATLNLEELKNAFMQILPQDSERAVTLGTANLSQLQQSEVATPSLLPAPTTHAPLVPIGFDAAKNSFYIVSSLIVVLLCSLYLLQRQVADYLRALFASLLGAGVLLVIYGVAVQWLVTHSTLDKIFMSGPTEVLQGLIQPFILLSARTNLWWGVAYIGLALFIFFAYRWFKARGQTAKIDSIRDIPKRTNTLY